MTWTKKKDTQEAREFWSHVESIAQKVRASEIYANYRVANSTCRHRADLLQPDNASGEDTFETRQLKRA